MINYRYLKQEEKELVNKFKDFLTTVLDFYENSFNIFSKKNSLADSDEAYDDAIQQDNKNITNCRDILDDCIWFIQKNEPRANHLRLIVAIINSLNDVKRISSYTVKMSKYCYKMLSEMDDDTVKIIYNIGLLTIKTSKQLLKIICEFNLDEMKNESRKIFEQYVDKYKKMFYESIKITLDKKQDAQFVANSIIVIKNFDRTIDHLMNIIQNLVSIN